MKNIEQNTMKNLDGKNLGEEEYWNKQQAK